MEQITVNLLATGETPVCHASQFDDGRTIRINLKKGADVYTLSGTEEVKMRIRKPDNTERVIDIVNTASSYVDYVSTPEDCDIAGVNVCELVIDNLGSKNFNMKVEEDAYGGGADIETLAASGPVATFETNIVDNLVDLKAEITPIQDLHGYDHPWLAGGGKNIAHFNTDNLDNSQQCTVTYIDDNNLSIDVMGNYARAMYAISCPENTTVTVSFKGSSTANYKKVQISSVNSWSGISWYRIINLTEQETTYSYTFTTSAGSTTIYIGFYVSAGANTGTMYIKDFQIEKGSSATSFAPYENVCPISGVSEAKVAKGNKNLVQSSKFVAASSAFTWGYRGEGFPLKGGVTYTFSIDIAVGSLRLVSVDEQTVYAQSSNGLTVTYTPPKDTLVVFRLWKSEGVQATEFQLEVGSDATDYEPYAGAEVTVQFGQTVYSGILDVLGGKVLIDMLKDTMTSSYLSGLSSAYIGYVASVPFFNGHPAIWVRNWKTPPTCKGRVAGGIKSLCNAFKITMNNNDIISTQYRVYFDVYNLNISSVSDFIAVVQNLELTDALEIMYEVETPIEIPLSAISQFETLLGVNNVYANTGDVDLKYLKQV